MKVLAMAAMAAMLPAAAVGTVSAQTTGMMHGVQHAGAKARCSPGDPNVMVNKSAKTFMMDTAAKKSSKGSMAGGSMADANPNASEADPKKNSAMVSMCKSEAMSMGAKMMSGGMHKSGK